MDLLKVSGILEFTHNEAAMTVNAHFDVKVIIPDEPLDLLPNEALIVQIERVGAREPAEHSALAWLADNALRTTRSQPIWPISTTTTSTTFPRKTGRDSGDLLRRYLLAGWRFRASETIKRVAVAWNQFVIRTRSSILPTEAALW